jgi:A/G-specific adenine glycosylase
MDIAGKLGGWYDREKRDLPWRNSNDIYRVWLSEIILQQTRVAQGTSYYLRFLERFPDVKSLAEADIQEVLKLWQGLGYYSRARNMHHTARIIVFENNGRFPANYSELLKLKGIGAYSAAAIASLVYNEAVAAVDGNVKRVITRLFGVTEEISTAEANRKINSIAARILDTSSPGRHNQAMIELGALICLPSKPDCDNCPVNSVCHALKNNMVAELPLKYKKMKSRDRFLTYLVITAANFTFVRRRPAGDIWEGLFEFPLIETESSPEDKDIPRIVSEFFNGMAKGFTISHISAPVIHKLSHRNLHTRFIHIKIPDKITFREEEFKIIGISEFGEYPVPRLLDKYIAETGF